MAHFTTARLRIQVFGDVRAALNGLSLFQQSNHEKNPAKLLLTGLVVCHDRAMEYAELERNLWGHVGEPGSGFRCMNVSAGLRMLQFHLAGGREFKDMRETCRAQYECRCQQLYPQELSDSKRRGEPAPQEPKCVRMRLVEVDGIEVLRLCNPTKSTLRLKLSEAAYVDLFEFDANYRSGDYPTKLRLAALCPPATLLRGSTTAWAEKRREEYARKYAELERTLLGSDASPVSQISVSATGEVGSVSSDGLATSPSATGDAPASHSGADTTTSSTSGMGSGPSFPALFLGREDALRDMKARLIASREQSSLISSRRAVVVRGWPGVGKTTLAAAVAHDTDIAEAYPDRILWASLGVQPDVRSLLAAWGRQLDSASVGSAHTVKEASKQIAAILRERRMLLVVDDVWQREHAVPFMVGGRGCATLLTTRDHAVAHALAPTASAVYPLRELAEEDALDVVKSLAPAAVAHHRQGCLELCRELGNLPLALQVAGRLLHTEAETGLNVEELLFELREGTSLLRAEAPSDMADLVSQTTPTVAVLLRKSTDRLEPYVQECFAWLGPYSPRPTTFDLDALKFIWQNEDPMPTVRTLVARGLLEYDGSGRYQMHALLVTHARNLILPHFHGG